jgi:ABC-type antimicrobial peptide transport system permease subunit
VNEKSSAAERRGGQSGSGWYVLSYAGNSIRKHKSRSLSLLLGVLIGVALVASVFVWTDTGTRVAIDDYFSDNLFQFSAQQRYEFPVDSGRVFAVKAWVDARDITESSYVVYHSVGLLGVASMNNAHPYLPYPYSLNIKDAEVFFADDTFLSAIRTKFVFNGTFAVQPGQCLVSQGVVDDARNVLNLTLTIGSYLDIAVAQVYPDNPSTIGDLNRLNITALRIGGIYELPVFDSVLYNAFPPSSRPNYPASGYELVFGWNDGIVLARSQLNESQLDTLASNGRSNGRTFPKLLMRLNSAKVLAYGLNQVAGIVRGFKAQLEVAFQGKVDVTGERQVIYLEQYIEAYQSRQTLGVLVMPVVVLSVFLTTFATNIFLSGRRAEVAILRARGASFRQLYAAFLLEFIVIGILAEFLGVFLSLFVGCLIPSSSAFLQFDFAVFFRFFAVVRLQPYVWLVAGLACLVPPLVFTMIYVRSFLRTEIYQAMVGISPPGESDIGVTILYFIGCLSLLALFLVSVLMLPATPSVAILQFIYAVAIWVLLSDSGSRVVRRGVAGITRVFRPVFGEKTSLFVKSMRTRRERIIPLLLILTLTFSVTIFSVVEAQTVDNNANRQIDYFIGADLRVKSDWVPSSRVSEIAAVPGVAEATTLVRTYAVIGTTSLVLIGIDNGTFPVIGHWDLSSMLGDDPATVFSRFKTDQYSIIFPATFAEQLGLTVGGQPAMFVYDQNSILVDDRAFTIVGLGHSAPGLGYFDPEDPARPPDVTSGFQFQESKIFALVHLSYLESFNITNSQLFLASLESNADVNQVQQDIMALGFPTAVYSPTTFSLEEAYPDGYLFNRGVISILSIGFLACLSISIIALTLFVGVIVAERQTEYAIMRAVGGTRRQIIAVVVGEFIGLILTSFIASVLLGGVFSWLLMNVLLDLFPFPYVIPFVIVPPWLLLLFILVTVIAAMAVGTYIPARRAGRTNVGRVLRNL